MRFNKIYVVPHSGLKYYVTWTVIWYNNQKANYKDYCNEGVKEEVE